MAEPVDPRTAFFRASVWHGDPETASRLLREDPGLATGDIYAAALMGDAADIRDYIAKDPGSATRKGGPLQWDPLSYLCFSIYLRLDPSHTVTFLDAAAALLDAGADPNTGFFDQSHRPNPEFESVLYAAAGVAHHAGLTRLLLARGADPNDEETPYHSPETRDNGALQVLLDSGKLSLDSLATMLLRKADWHDPDGMRILLQGGADPNRMTRWGFTALQQALRRDNALENIELLLDHGADGRTAIPLAIRRGRGDVLELLQRRGISLQPEGVDRLIAACALGNRAAALDLAAQEPSLRAELLAEGGRLLAHFAGTANAEGVAILLDLGVPVDAFYQEGDPYYDIAANSTALHVAAWRAWHSVVKLLLERGATVDALDGKGRTPLALAVRACVDSYWSARRRPDSVAALLRAGAQTRQIAFPSGYAEVDALLSGTSTIAARPDAPSS